MLTELLKKDYLLIIIFNWKNLKLSFFVYILLCNDGSYYTGYTQNLAQRIKLHTNGKGARYTKSRRPIKLAFVELFDSRSQALKREKNIKKMSHVQKQKLIIKNGYSPN